MILKEELKTKKGLVFGWVFDDVLSYNQCQSLIDTSSLILKKSSTLGPQIDNYRTSSNCFLKFEENKNANHVANLISHFLDVPVENFEAMQVVHYSSGQRYKEHRDSFNPEDIEEQFKRGGQRTWTAFAYLNNVQKGGETFFPLINQSISPKIGRMVFWKNSVDGEVVQDSLHEAMPPINCEKWGANVWVRENKFI